MYTIPISVDNFAVVSLITFFIVVASLMLWSGIDAATDNWSTYDSNRYLSVPFIFAGGVYFMAIVTICVHFGVKCPIRFKE